MIESRNYLDFECSYLDAKVVFLGIPFDGTSSFRPGSRFAPSAIRQYSVGLESYSPYFDRSLTDCYVHDMGDLSLPFGNTKRVIEIIETQISKILEDDKKVLACGGEHLISYPILKSYAKKYENLHLLHFDAHADLRTDYLGERCSHASVIRLVTEVISPNRIFQFGIRSGEKDEFEYAKANTRFYPFDLQKVGHALSAIPPQAPVYISLDLDILDPSVLPATGTPEPGGVYFNELLEATRKLKQLNVVGIDVVELAPDYDSSGVSNIVAAKLIRELTFLISPI
jgi:agmatinase